MLGPVPGRTPLAVRGHQRGSGLLRLHGEVDLPAERPVYAVRAHRDPLREPGRRDVPPAESDHGRVGQCSGRSGVRRVLVYSQEEWPYEPDPYVRGRPFEAEGGPRRSEGPAPGHVGRRCFGRDCRNGRQRQEEEGRLQTTRQVRSCSSGCSSESRPQADPDPGAPPCRCLLLRAFPRTKKPGRQAWEWEPPPPSSNTPRKQAFPNGGTRRLQHFRSQTVRLQQTNQSNRRSQTKPSTQQTSPTETTTQQTKTNRPTNTTTQ